MTPNDGSQSVILLGIGNVLWADEGFGVWTIEELRRRYRFSPQVQLLDGGTQGLYLLQHVQQAEILLVFDAIDYGLPPATMKLIYDDEVPKYLGAKKMSLHQTGFQEVLATAAMLGDYPNHLLLIGVQPAELEDYGGGLRPEIKAQMRPAINCALDYLATFGIQAQPIATAAHTADPLLDMANYEAGRPSAQAACRVGDARVLGVAETGIVPMLRRGNAD